MHKKSILAETITTTSAGGSLIAVLPLGTRQPTNRSTRQKLWELQDCWHCMVVGTCLTLTEVRQAASKSRLSVVNKSDYDIHQLAVECAADKQHPLTQRLHKLLERKYANAIKQFRAAKTAEELSEHWLRGWDSGAIASSLWALITHPAVNRVLIMEAFGQVHMLSHLAGASVCVDRRLRLKQEEQNSALTHELKELKARCREVTTRFREQTTMLETEQARIRTLQAQADQAKAQLQKLSASLSVKSTDFSHLVEPLQMSNRKLRLSVLEGEALSRQQKQEIKRLQRLLSGYEKPERQSDAEDMKLCGQCVLYLGGKAQQRRHFQALVESCDGRFLHHDGGRESCPHRIADLVSQADVVMCPTDCISHGAMEKARALCAKQDKPIVFMQRSSLSSFTRSLQEVIG